MHDGEVSLDVEILGQLVADDLVDDERQAARDLARFVVELRGMDDVGGAARAGRQPPRELDAITRVAIESGRGIIDSDAATTAWERVLADLNG